MNAYWKLAQHSLLMLLALVLLSLTVMPGQAVAGRASLDIRNEKGFARLVFSFDKLPEYSSKTVSTVFVIKFKKSVAVDLAQVATKLSNVLTIARRDPDGYGLRFAMVRDFRVNVQRAGNHLIVDFLSKNWRGRPPGIPQDIVDKLAREAEKARLAAAERERQEALQADPLLVEVHYVSQPTFHRISFNWNRFVTAQFTRKGDKVTILFGGRAVPDLAHLKINPPPNLKRISHVLGPKSLRIVMQVLKGTKVRAFREGRNYVVDLTINKPLNLSKVAQKLYAAASRDNETAGAKKMEEVSLPETQEDQNTAPQKPVKTAKKPPTGEKPARQQGATPPLPVRSMQIVNDQKEPQAKATGTRKKEQNQSEKPTDKALLPVRKKQLNGSVKSPSARIVKEAGALGAETPASRKPASIEANPHPKTATPEKSPVPKRTLARGTYNPLEQHGAGDKNKAVVARVEEGNDIEVVRNENSVQLRFPLQKKNVAAAIFQRNEILWVLLDSTKKIKLAGLKAQLGGIVKDIRRSQLDKAQLFEFQLTGPWLSSVSQRDEFWNISIGDLVTGSSKKFKRAKRINSSGIQEVFIATTSRGRLHQIKDRHSGDDLLVLTSKGPAQSIKKIYDHVEFQLFKTIHGIVVRPLSDSLRVGNTDSGIKISGVEGLYLSGDLQKVIEEAEKPHNRRRIKARKLLFNKITSRDIRQFNSRTLELEKKIATNNGRARRRARLDLAQHWLSRGLAPEGLAMLEIAAANDAEIVKDPVFRLLRGITNVQLRRYKLAGEDLGSNDLEDNPHASLWRGVAAYRLKNFDRALVEMKRGEEAINSYLPRLQAMFRLVGAEVAIENKDPVLAGSELDNIPKAGVNAQQTAMARFLEGRLMELQNRPLEALQLYADATKADIRPVTARAVFRLTDLRLRTGALKPDAGIDILERLSIVWRGDDVELDVLSRLADLHLTNGRYDEAFSLMGTAVRAFPRSERALALQDRMKAQFQELFLQDKADKLPPIKALALFYDHKNLTPPGRLGDEMIRRLADRLIKVDLLDKAAGLLEHQVKRRLKGAGRAQVAIRLAMIHLLQQQPKKALKIIYQTRQPKLPAQVRQARRLLEARAYAELGRSGPALELLANDDSQQAGEIKSLALWKGEKWAKAGEEYEKLLGAQWRGAGELPQKARVQVLRAAISYTLGGDQLGVERLREKYASKMSRGADAKAFAMITDSLKTGASAIGKLARDIADIDTLEAFIKAFRQRLDRSGGPQTTSAVN